MSNRIRIVRNPLTLGLSFIGVTSSTDDPFGKRYTGIASGSNVSIVKDAMSVAAGTTIYALKDIPYTRFIDADGNDFTDANNAVNYINTQAAVGTLRFPTTDQNLEITVAMGNTFSYKLDFDRRSSYFWDEDTVPAGLSVSAFDNRKISGQVFATGTYNIEFEVANYFGTTTSTLVVNVV